MRLTVTDGRGVDLAPFIAMLDALGDDELARIDAEEACPRIGEGDVGVLFSFAELSRVEQAQILQALDANLVRTKRVYPGRAPSSYALKHKVEREVGLYTSNLHAKTAMRVLGFEKGGGQPNPLYGVGSRSYEKWCDSLRGKWYQGRDGSGVEVAVALRIGEGPLPICEFNAWYAGEPMP